MKTPEEIAAGLSEAQRYWLANAEPTLKQVDKQPCEQWWDNPDKLYVERDGEIFWLASRGMESPAGYTSFTKAWEQLTPLGLAVRRILEDQRHD